MLDDLNELKTLQQVLANGSLTAAARSLGVSLAVVSKRIATLERRAGVRLVNRTTRTLSPTMEGAQLLIEIERALEAIRHGEEQLAAGRDDLVGTLRVSAPVSFGRRHVAPVLARLAQDHARLGIHLSLDERLIDVAGGTLDVAIRIGGPGSEGSVTMRKIADNERILVAAPTYLDDRGRPHAVDDLAAHEMLRVGDAIVPWRLTHRDGTERLVPVPARLRVDNGDAVHDWCVAGLGLMLKSKVDVATDLRSGALERVLPEWSGGDAPIVALFADRVAMPRRTRVFLDAMVEAMARI